MPSPRNYLVDAYNQLSRDINKLPGRLTLDTQQGVVSIKVPEISIDMGNTEMLRVLDLYQKNWIESSVYAEWVKRSDENENYWKGKHFQRPETDKTRALVDNVIFESLETALPQYISQPPEADVELRPSELNAQGEPTNPIGTIYVDTMTQELGDLADDIRLKLKMKKAARHWALNLLGVAKVGWDVKRDIPMLKVVRPRKVILDPNATIDEDGYTGELIGELRTLPAYKILPYCTEEGAEDAIKSIVGDDLATKVQFIEWWSDTTLIWAIGGKQVLMKRRNPHWNWGPDSQDDEGSDFTPVGIAPEGYEEEQMPIAGDAPASSSPSRPTIPNMTKATSGLGGNTAPVESMPPAVTETAGAEGEDENEAQDEVDDDSDEDEDAMSMPKESKSHANHFPGPQKPYLFIVMFNLGDQPVDNTSLITQNLANQDLINKRNKQIDHNADNLNNGLVVSLERSGLTMQQARGVTSALRKGGVVGIPTGVASDAVFRPDMGVLPEGLYENLEDLRGRVYSIFGTKGSQPDTSPSATARGQILNKTLDTDRIGGGISEILEQFADDFFNWAIQLKLVYEDKYVQLGAVGLTVVNPETKQPENYGLPMVRCTVKQGSLLPKDKTTLANQAIELAGSGKMSLLDLYTALEYSNAEDLAVNAWLEVNAPDLLYPDDPRVQQAIQRAQQAAAAEAQAKDKGASEKQIPSTSISFKDLPPDGQAQLAAKVGIQLHPEGIAAHEQLATPPPATAPVPAVAQPAPAAQ